MSLIDSMPVQKINKADMISMNKNIDIIKEYLRENEVITQEDIIEIFGNYYDISDQYGWHNVDEISLGSDDNIIAWVSDQEGECDELYFSYIFSIKDIQDIAYWVEQKI